MVLELASSQSSCVSEATTSTCTERSLRTQQSLHDQHHCTWVEMTVTVACVLLSSAAKKYNELFPKEKKEKEKPKKGGGGAEGGSQQKEGSKKQEKKKKAEEKSEEKPEEEEEDVPKPPKFKDPYVDLPPR